MFESVPNDLTVAGGELYGGNGFGAAEAGKSDRLHAPDFNMIRFRLINLQP